MEHKSRRNHLRKWQQFCQQAPWKELYNPDEIAKQLETNSKEDGDYVYTGEGDSYFVSPEMYNSLVAVCRCGRPRKGLHLLKCLQKQQNSAATVNKAENDNKTSNKLTKPSSSFSGWRLQQPSYKQWENSMKYKSPIFDIPGGKITSTSYNVLMIG